MDTHSEGQEVIIVSAGDQVWAAIKEVIAGFAAAVGLLSLFAAIIHGGVWRWIAIAIIALFVITVIAALRLVSSVDESWANRGLK